MTTETEVPPTTMPVFVALTVGARARPHDARSHDARHHEEGLITGILGAATIALWFLLVDVIHGRPLYTPTLLGTVLFRHGDAAALDAIVVSLEMAGLYTVVHVLVFSAIGNLASESLAIAQRYPEVGFGILLLFVIFEFAVTVSPILFAAPLVRALSWPALLVANLLATTAMATYLWHRHPMLRVSP